jgi:hypothetical protein
MLHRVAKNLPIPFLIEHNHKDFAVFVTAETIWRILTAHWSRAQSMAFLRWQVSRSILKNIPPPPRPSITRYHEVHLCNVDVHTASTAAGPCHSAQKADATRGSLSMSLHRRGSACEDNAQHASCVASCIQAPHCHSPYTHGDHAAMHVAPVSCAKDLASTQSTPSTHA